MPARKKDSSVRARRNVAASAATLTASAKPVPEMPVGPDWHPETVRWWNDVWSSPMSPEWDDSDEHNVILCALLYNDIWLAATARDRKDAAGEFRLQRRDLGLTPYDRRRLEWTIETADEAKDRGRRRRAQPQQVASASGAVDPRSVLRAVN